MSDDAQRVDTGMQDVNEQMLIRRQKLDKLRAAGIDPYAVERFDRSHEAAQIHENFSELEDQEVAVAGRIMSIRTHGKASFAHIQDMSGRIQLYVRIDQVGEEAYQLFLDLDLGDIIGVHGKVFRTRRGEISVAVDSFELLCKALRPLPEKMAWVEGRRAPVPDALCGSNC